MQAEARKTAKITQNEHMVFDGAIVSLLCDCISVSVDNLENKKTQTHAHFL
jgi:hypothetical protein